MARSTVDWKYRVEDRRTGFVVSRHKVGHRAAARLRKEHASWLRYGRTIPSDYDPEEQHDKHSQSPFRLIEISTGRVPTNFHALRPPPRKPKNSAYAGEPSS